MGKIMAPYKGQQIVVTTIHALLRKNALVLVIDLFLEPKPGVPPTPTHSLKFITKMRSDNVHVVIVDPYLQSSHSRNRRLQNQRNCRGGHPIPRRRQRD